MNKIKTNLSFFFFGMCYCLLHLKLVIAVMLATQDHLLLIITVNLEEKPFANLQSNKKRIAIGILKWEHEARGAKTVQRGESKESFCICKS